MGLFLLLFILLAAAATRLWHLDSIPPGFTHDEAGHGHDAVAIMRGARPIYQTVGYGREPLYDYWVAGLMGLFGPTGSILRFSSVLLGLVTLLLTYVWVRLAFDGPTALAAVALQTASFWSLSASRQALRSVLLPLLFTAAAYFLWRSCKAPDRPRRWQVALVALFIGAMFYTYIAARVLWIVFPAFLIYLALFHRDTFHRMWRPTLVAVSIGLLLAVPLFVYLRAHPGAEQRLDMVDAPLDALRKGDPTVVLEKAGSAVSGILLPGHGDDFLAYTIPGRPVFDWLTGALFLGGLVVCLARWRDPPVAFSLLWLLAGISPSLITGATASSTRSIGALPVVFLFPALAVISGARWATDRWGYSIAWATGVGFIGLILATGVRSAYDYYVVWGESVDVRAAYQHTLIEMARYLEVRPEIRGVALSSIYPHAPHDPYVFDVALRREDLSPRWFDARRALVLPAEPAPRLLAPSSGSLDPYFADLPGLHLRQRVTVQPDDLDPFFLVYDWEPQITLAALRERTEGLPLDLALPVNFDVLQLLGYDLRTPIVSPGGTVELVTLWQATALDPADANSELVLFSHALDADGVVVGQEDRLDAPIWDWQPGDVIAQIHRFALQADVSPGSILLEVGAYWRANLTRLPILMDGAVVGDRVLIPGVEVKDQ